MDQYKSDFFNRANIELHRILRLEGSKTGDITLVPDLLERGKGFIMTWLKDASLKETYADDAQMYYYNVACIAFCGGIAYADAWDKDITQVKTGIVDTLLASQRDISALAADILDIDDSGQYKFHKLEDKLFEVFLEIMSPYWDKEDPRPFLFQGLLAFFQTGVSYRLDRQN